MTDFLVMQVGKGQLVNVNAYSYIKPRALIEEGAKNLQGRVIVLGAGLLEPIEKLAQQFDEVLLVNYDKDFLDNVLVGKSSSKMKCKIIDCTDGLLAQVENILSPVTSIFKAPYEHEVIDCTVAYQPPNLPSAMREGIIKQLIELFNHVVVSPASAWVKEMGQADYVISSRLCLDLARKIDTFVKTYLGPLSDDENYNKAFVTLNNRLAEQLFNDLKALTKAHGRVYFSDNYARKATSQPNGSSGKGAKEIMVLPMLYNNFELDKSIEWDDVSSGNLVISQLLRLKTAPSAPTAAAATAPTAAAATAPTAAATAAPKS